MKVQTIRDTVQSRISQSMSLDEPISVEGIAASVQGLFPKFEQIGFYTSDIAGTKKQYEGLGCKTWVDDTVVARGFVADGNLAGGDANDVYNVAHLAFNYDLGTELELITYKSGTNWHLAGGRVAPYRTDPFLSHMSYHTQDMDTEIDRLKSFKIAQRVDTLLHTNPFLVECGRLFKYCVFDTRKLLGFDVKIIQRVERNERTR